MKNRIMISALCIYMLLTGSGCGTGAGNETPPDENMESVTLTESEISSDEDMEQAALTESNQEEPTKPRNYEELIAAARECVEGKVEEEQEVYYDFSYIIYQFGPYYGASMGLGYLIEDIDGDGTDELIFGQNSEPGTAADGIIYDLYTISEGEVVHVFCGGERDFYMLCENGMLARDASDGAPTGLYAYYTLEGTELHLVEAVIYNGWRDEREEPWFYSTQYDSIYEENTEPISAEQAQTIMEKYVYEHPAFTPFVEE